MDRFLIATASGRALAESARNAGYSVDVFDLFGDWDLQNSVKDSTETLLPWITGSVFTARDFSDLFSLVDLSIYRAAIIGGGFESKNELVERLNHWVPILGCQSSQLNRLGSHACLDVIPHLVEKSGARWPATQTTAPKNIRTATWLQKNLRGSGGNHVHAWPPQISGDEVFLVTQDCVFQQLIEGTSISALFVAQGRRRDQPTAHASSKQRSVSRCQLIGCSQQLVGVPVFGANPFSYCGSIAPLELPENQRAIIEQLGTSISTEFEIEGIFGLDLIVNDRGVWLIDINPRIPASAELYERLAPVKGPNSFSVFKRHVDACLGKDKMEHPPILGEDRCLAKGILFCKFERGLFISESIFSWLQRIYDEGLSSNSPSIADIPNPGTRISTGEPVLTFYVEARSEPAAQRELIQFAEQLNTSLTKHCV